MNKRAYFFLLDGLLAVITLVIGFMLISSAQTKEPTLVVNTQLSEDLMNMLASTDITDLCDGCSCNSDYPILDDMCNDINNMDNSLLELIGDENNNVRFFGYEDMASIIGTSRETFSRIIANLKKEGVLSNTGDKHTFKVAVPE